MDLSTFVNAPIAIQLAGREYRVSALTLKEWGPIQSWIKQNVPGPMKSITSDDIAGLNEVDRRMVLTAAAAAQQNWPPRIGSLEWFRSLDHPGGHAEFLFVSLSKHQPSLTRADAEALDGELSLADVMPVVVACLGMDQNDLKPNRANPIAPQATLSGTTRSGSRNRSTGRTKPSKR